MKKTIVVLIILFNANLAFGYITNDVPNACYSQYSPMEPIFQINQYTCGNGYYLPANIDGCRSCPDNATCVGGTWTFNTNDNQGIACNTFLPVNETGACDTFYNNSVPVFQPNQHTCARGYYMPANYDGCVLCPADSYCVGGTYTFNKTTAQGITACASGLFAPAGMWEPEQCGRILHVGDGFVYLRSTKITEHALHVDLDHDGIADYFGNMTTLDVPMSSGTQRKLKLRWNNTTYSVYDDSVDLSLYE